MLGGKAKFQFLGLTAYRNRQAEEKDAWRQR
jgi:hypothetical protein